MGQKSKRQRERREAVKQDRRKEGTIPEDGRSSPRRGGQRREGMEDLRMDSRLANPPLCTPAEPCPLSFHLPPAPSVSSLITEI